MTAENKRQKQSKKLIINAFNPGYAAKWRLVYCSSAFKYFIY